MTLGQTEKGYPAPIEHVGIPKTVLQEKGMTYLTIHYLKITFEFFM